MEREYEEEIEELRKEGRNLQSLLDERRFDARKDVTQDLNYTTTDEFRKIELQKEVEKYRHELEVSSKAIADLKSENAQLRHRVDILEISKESVRFIRFFRRNCTYLLTIIITFSLA